MAKIKCPQCGSNMVEIKKGLHVCPMCKKEIEK